MPTGPQGQKRPADTVGCAVKVMKIATGQEPETPPRQPRKPKPRAGQHPDLAKTPPGQ